jgi:CO dehydrogenase maturation factor
MKIAIAGKGGSGKTTIAGILARSLAHRGHEVWAIDADSNPNLGATIGVPAEERKKIRLLEEGILKETANEKDQRTMQLAFPPREVAQRFGVPAADRLTLLLMGTVDHAGAG